MKEEISSENMNDPFGFSTYDIIYKCPLLSYKVKKLFISYFLSPFYLSYYKLTAVIFKCWLVIYIGIKDNFLMEMN